MKKMMSAFLILGVMSLGAPCVSAEIYKDLDPMVSPESQEILAEEGSVSNVVSTESAIKKEKKSEGSKKEKVKKSSKEKASKKGAPSGAKKSPKKASSQKVAR